MILLWTCESQLRRLERRSDWFLLPDWVLGEVDLPRDAAATRRVRGTVQKIRKYSLGYRVTHDPCDFDDFYANMYVPYTRKAFGTAAYVYTHRMLKKVFLSGDLLLVEKDGKSLAGVLIDYDDATPHLFMLGVRDADQAVLRDGAGGAALFFYALQYLQEKGYKTVLLGWTRPFLRDGVFEFKRRWSQRICGSRYWGFGLKVVSSTLAVKSFLSNNPCIFKEDGLLYAGVFVDAHQLLSPQDVEQLIKDHSHAGLAGVKLYRLPPGSARVLPAAVGLPAYVEPPAAATRPATAGVETENFRKS
jgi:hypothetical protein